jgi:hypothetical protein
LRGLLTSRAAPGEPNVSTEGGGVETAHDATANFRRRAADPLPHDEPEAIAASRAAAARWSSAGDERGARGEAPAEQSAKDEGGPVSDSPPQETSPGNEVPGEETVGR